MESNQQDILARLNLLMERFPRGLNLSKEDLALIGWLYFYESETGSRGVSDAQLKWIIPEASKNLALDEQPMQWNVVVQKLMRFGILRASVTDQRNHGYRLTRLGLGLAKELVEEVDYSSEQLNILLSCALNETRLALDQGADSFFKYLKYVFLGTIQEKVEDKLLAIDEDLQERKKEVRRTYSGQDQGVFEKAIRDIEHCRIALSELVDAVQESSACVSLEKELHALITQDPIHDLYDVLEQSLNFIYRLRDRVDSMLKDVVQFIHDCVAYRSLAFTVDSRERLRRIQELIITFALEHDVRMPILDSGRLPRFDLNWSIKERARSVLLDMEMVREVEDYCFQDTVPSEPDWKESLLHMAREEWTTCIEQSGINLGAWLKSLMDKLPRINENPCLAIWFLTQDWPNWRPSVTAELRPSSWVPLGEQWWVEDVHLIPGTSLPDA